MVFKLWSQLVDAICRPPRDLYEGAAALPGGELGHFLLEGRLITRTDFVVVNKKAQNLQCSLYQPSGVKSKDHNGVPCGVPMIIYCHCNSGSRRDANEAVKTLAPMGISVCSLDFSGSGLSDGDYVTLGANECEDLEAVVSHLREKQMASTLGLWGRSMGAVTALMYTARDPSIAGVVADSPFSHLPDLLVEIVSDQKLPIPKFFLRFVLWIMKRSVKSRAKFDLDSVSPIKVMRTAFIPAVFSHGKEDDFIRPHHSQRLHDACSSADKRLVMFDGTHNSPRPEYFYTCVGQFFYMSLRLDEMLQQGSGSMEREAHPIGVVNPVRHVSSTFSSQHEVRPRGGQVWVGRSLGDAGLDDLAAALENSSAVREGDLSVSNFNSEQAVQSIRRWGESARLEMQTSKQGVLAELMGGGGGGSTSPEGEETLTEAPEALGEEEDDEVTRQMINEAIRLSLQESQGSKPPSQT